MEGDLSRSYPKIIEDSLFWSNVESLTKPDVTGRNLAIDLATVGLLTYCRKNNIKMLLSYNLRLKKG